MSNLFKKGFASIALASAMASGVFAGNAAYIDVKINYLGGMGKAVLGYSDTNVLTNKRLDEVELLVSILDEDGNYATKNFNGTGNLDAVKISTEGAGALATGVTSSTGVIKRALKSGNSIQRFVLDYSNAQVANLMDTITLISGKGSGKIERTINIDLRTRDARGLIVRATPNSTFQTEEYISALFSGITIASEGNTLNKQSTKAPGGLVGLSIPIQVYASTFSNNASTSGRFTFAPNLEGKTIVVQALGDYNKDSVPSTVLNSIEIEMIKGKASGSIVITNSMPATANGITVTSPSIVGYGNSDDVGGLGIAFVAYVKEKQSINNYTDEAAKKIRDNTNMANFSFSTTIGIPAVATGITTTGLRDGADTIQVKSGEPVAMKVGIFDANSTTLSKLWKSTSEIFNVSEGIDVLTDAAGTAIIAVGATTNADGTAKFLHSNVKGVKRVLTIVDSFGNPAIGNSVSTATLKIDGESSTATNDTIINSKSAIPGVDAVATVSAGATTINDAKTNGVTTITVSLSDGDDFNSTLSIKSQKLTINAADGVLSNVKAKDLTIRTLPLIEVTKNGGPNWIDSISDVQTKDEFSQSDHAFLKKKKDVTRADENDLTIVIKSGIGDSDLTDRNATFRVYIKDKSGEGEFLEGAELKKYKLTIIANPDVTGTITTSSDAGPNFTQSGLFYTDTGSAVTTATVNGQDKSADGYWRFDFLAAGTSNTNLDKTLSITAVDDFAIQIGTTASSETPNIATATILVENFNVSAIKEEEIIVNIPANEDKYTAAYVDVYMEGLDDLKEVPTGSIVNFKFTGSSVSTGDMVVIDMNSSGLGTKTNGKTNGEGRIGLVGSDSINKSGMITTALPENHIVSVMLYDANSTNLGTYGFGSGESNITINGRNPVWLNLKDDGDTDILELAMTDSIVTMKPKKDAITQIRIDGNRVLSPNKGDGSEEDKSKSFGTDADFMYDGMFNGPDNAVKTGLYYSLFNSESDVILLDKYKNTVEGLQEDIGKDVKYSTTDGMEFKNNGAEGSWIKFAHKAAGTNQTLTLTRTLADGTKATKTMTWANIKLNTLNTKFMVTTDANGPTDPNTGAFDVINSEVVVKVIGDGKTKQSSTTIKVTHSDKTATVRLVKINGLKAINLYTNALVGATSSTGDVVEAGGNYYILSSDKTGTVTITATAKGKDSKGKDTTVAGTHTVVFDAIDLDKPVINGDDVTVGGGQVSVTVQDANLDTVKTTVVVKNRDGKKVADGVYANGKFTAKVASSGTYLIDIIAFDMAGNVQLDADGKPQPFEFVRISGAGAPSVEEEAVATLLAKKEYAVMGTFTSHKFGADKAKNWVYIQKSDGKAYQLLGNAPSAKDIFGWKEVEVKASTENVWYMIRTGEGKFDWALANVDGVAYKLKGAKSDGTFDFSGRLNLNTSYKDGMLTFTAK